MTEQELPKEFLMFDRTEFPYTGDVLYPFALDELLCRRVGQGHAPIVHLWIHRKAFVVGLRDRRLPCAVQAIEDLELQGYEVAVRNSGGAAVPLDPGVVNISLILPKSDGAIDIHADFAQMAGLISETVERMAAVRLAAQVPARAAAQTVVKVNAGEVKGSYCPGDFDLSIKSRKFCGIAQRRQTRAYVVQAFVNVANGDVQRADVVRTFYQKATANEGSTARPMTEASKDNRPFVAVETMASLSEFIVGISVSHFVEELKNTFLLYANRFETMKMSDSLHNETLEMIQQLKERYDQRDLG